jgi:serine/arginine repetitive matrix protein 2
MAFPQRANPARSKSRSPAPPPSPLLNTSSTPTFRSPSYYAAAAGVQYPLAKGFSDAGLRALDTLLHSPAPAHRADIRSPRVCNELEHFSNHTPTMTPDDRLSSATRHIAEASTPTKIARRKSQVDLMEASLLPSLRDTIGRMTQVDAARSLPQTYALLHPSKTSHPDAGTMPGWTDPPSLPSAEPHQASVIPTRSFNHRNTSQRPSLSASIVGSSAAAKTALRLPGNGIASRAADGVSSPTSSLKRTPTAATKPRKAVPKAPDQDQPRILSSASKVSIHAGA